MSEPTIDGKICDKPYSSSSYGPSSDASLCSKHSSRSPENGKFHLFADKALVGGTKNWPTSSVSSTTQNDNAIAVAKDIIKLSKDEKSVVAGHLAKSIEGGEVVERVATKYSALRGVVVCYQCRILHKERFRSGS